MAADRRSQLNADPLGGRSEALNWDALGAIAETVGAAGVIATLLYLAAQIRANTRSVRASTHQDSQAGLRQLHLALAQDPELSRIWSSGVIDFESLSREDKIRFDSTALFYMLEFQNAHYQFDQGTLDESAWTNWRNQLQVMCSLPGFATWWEREKLYNYFPYFRALVDRLVAQGRKPAAY